MCTYSSLCGTKFPYKDTESLGPASPAASQTGKSSGRVLSIPVHWRRQGSRASPDLLGHAVPYGTHRGMDRTPAWGSHGPRPAAQDGAARLWKWSNWWLRAQTLVSDTPGLHHTYQLIILSWQVIPSSVIREYILHRVDVRRN